MMLDYSVAFDVHVHSVTMFGPTFSSIALLMVYKRRRAGSVRRMLWSHTVRLMCSLP